MANIIRNTVDIRVDIEATVSRINEAYAMENNDERAQKLSDEVDNLVELEVEYAQTSEYEKVLALSKMEKPMLEAIKSPEYKIVRHRDVKDETTKLVTGIESVEYYRDIDLLRLDRFTKYTASAVKGWQNTLSKFNQLVVFRVCAELGIDVRKVRKDYYLSPVAKEIDLGKTPTSNTQMLKQFQKLVDQIIFEDNGKGANVYKATSRDIAFIMNAITKMGKERGTIVVGKDTTMRKIVLGALNNVVEHAGYKVAGYKTNSNK